ncbi:hypothetical protein OWR29_39620 [Actinoplanes sp. Pm04-4]|uniref:Uncharacterized protein n=1 Tax=Paractinoplanes pyxinae TaxID=2997416 RepID=A0ABT4BC90_9ACTN|nr:hypothetical protein [Actinoplanes pyxinae]MCY1144141.1 hypothetical protein [Actinoplanes pyxinae]
MPSFQQKQQQPGLMQCALIGMSVRRNTAAVRHVAGLVDRLPPRALGGK